MLNCRRNSKQSNKVLSTSLSVFGLVSIILLIYFEPQISGSAKLVNKYKENYVIPTITSVHTYDERESKASRGQTSEQKQETEKQLYADKVVKAINANLECLLENKGQVFYDRGKEHNVNPMLMAAISMHETLYAGKFGNSPVLKNLKNVAGINWSGAKNEPHVGRYKDYTNTGGIDDSINHLAYILSNYYIKYGRTSIDLIGEKYCPINDKENGKYGMCNETWSGKVTEYYNRITRQVN